MPYTQEWVAPEVFMQHKGVTIYHTYDDGDFNNGPMKFWYTTCENDTEVKFHFDVRDLPTDIPRPVLNKSQECECKRIISDAINSGLIKQTNQSTFER